MEFAINGFRLDYTGGAEQYLLLTGDAVPIADSEMSELEQRMLSLHAIPGLAPFRAERTNMQIQLYYRITGKKPLSIWLRSSSPDLDSRVKLLFRIIDCLEEGTGYLLAANRYLLAQDAIYIGEGPNDVGLIYTPLTRGTSGRTVIEEMNGLAIALLSGQSPLPVTLKAGIGSLVELKKVLQDMLLKQTMNPSASEVVERREEPIFLPRPSTDSVPPLQVQSGWFTRVVQFVKESLPRTEEPRTPSHSLPLSTTGSQEVMERYYEQLPAHTTLLTAPDATELLSEVAEGKPDLPRLEWEEEGKSRRIAITDGRLMIGRAEEADLRPDVVGISRLHAEIVEGELIADLGSRNGTFLKEERLIPFKPYPLADGDAIWIAGMTFIYRTGRP